AMTIILVGGVQRRHYPGETATEDQQSGHVSVSLFGRGARGGGSARTCTILEPAPTGSDEAVRVLSGHLTASVGQRRLGERPAHPAFPFQHHGVNGADSPVRDLRFA